MRIEQALACVEGLHNVDHIDNATGHAFFGKSGSDSYHFISISFLNMNLPHLKRIVFEVGVSDKTVPTR
ncbi:hypothetical protein [Sporosarcina limicola]|uniref:Uncharacterized protein n=1 Tax=Sporosarcina limicola TaxID=34101 RepID=A0A927MKD3_9BACL|nr:hypothetical protein [Sporosarcina limicola]MBE1556208.1 hypothetical protein [Sporosarcina limicola]